MERPSWVVPALCFAVLALVILLAIACVLLTVVTAQRDVAESERDLWMEFALSEDPRPGVRLVENGQGFDCKYFGVRREWELAVAAECAVMGRLLMYARTPK